MHVIYTHLVQYWGSDVAAMLFTWAALYLLGSKYRSGFLVFLLANFSWLTFGFLVQSIPCILANVVNAFFNVRGFIRWEAKKKPGE